MIYVLAGVILWACFFDALRDAGHETHQAEGTCLEVHVPEHLVELVEPYLLS